MVTGQQAAMADVPDTNQVLSRPGPRATIHLTSTYDAGIVNVRD